MNDFKKKFNSNSKPGGFSRGGARPSFGGDRGGPRRPDSRGFDAPKELYKTSCAKCQNACEVPFRPNGMKPVYCKDCFVRDDERAPRDSFQKKSFGTDRAPRATAPTEDYRIGGILKELQNVNAKLDGLMARLENIAYASILTASTEKTAKATKVVAEEKPVVKAVKKVAKKAVSKKK